MGSDLRSAKSPRQVYLFIGIFKNKKGSTFSPYRNELAVFEEEVVCSYQDKAALGSEVMIYLTSQIYRYKEENPNWRRRKGTAKLSEKKGNGEERREEKAKSI
ncbi:hypothetical protein GOBAR_DD26888 [Gossypium barbadense]|nr:hypothetical protein GOBAR_DD26888 [Gossypium barbadense]